MNENQESSEMTAQTFLSCLFSGVMGKFIAIMLAILIALLTYGICIKPFIPPTVYKIQHKDKIINKVEVVGRHRGGAITVQDLETKEKHTFPPPYSMKEIK